MPTHDSLSLIVDYVNSYPILDKSAQRHYWEQYNELKNLLDKYHFNFSSTSLSRLKTKYKGSKPVLNTIRLGVKARQQLIHCVAPMIFSLCSRYKNAIPIEQSFSAGIDGVSHALNKFHPYGNTKTRVRQLNLFEEEDIIPRETKFSSYARTWIFSRIMDEIKALYPIKMSHTAKQTLCKDYQFISTNLETFKGIAYESSISRLNEIMMRLPEVEQEILDNIYNDYGDRDSMLNALYTGKDLKEVEAIENRSLAKARKIANSL